LHTHRRPLAGLPVSGILQALESLPIGLEVTHSPNPAEAQRGGPSGYRYTWVYSTTVRALHVPVAIIAFGAFVLHDGAWVFANVTGPPFTHNDFADWYACPQAVLWPGRKYSDPANWGGSNSLRSLTIKWVFIGIGIDGRQVKGEAVVEELGRIEKNFLWRRLFSVTKICKN